MFRTSTGLRSILAIAAMVTASTAGAQVKPASTTASAKAVTKVKVSEDKPGLLAKAKVTADSAVAIARTALPGANVTGAEIESEDGALIYSFDMKTPGKPGIDELHIDAMSGKLLKKAHETPADEKKEAAADAKENAAAKIKTLPPAAKKPPAF